MYQANIGILYMPLLFRWRQEDLIVVVYMTQHSCLQVTLHMHAPNSLTLAPTTVKDMVMAINATQYNTKQSASPHQILARSKSKKK